MLRHEGGLVAVALTLAGIGLLGVVLLTGVVRVAVTGWACLQRISLAQAEGMDRELLLSDAQWELIEPLLPAQRPVTDGRCEITARLSRESSTDIDVVSPGVIFRRPSGHQDLAQAPLETRPR